MICGTHLGQTLEELGAFVRDAVRLLQLLLDGGHDFLAVRRHLGRRKVTSEHDVITDPSCCGFWQTQCSRSKLLAKHRELPDTGLVETGRSISIASHLRPVHYLAVAFGRHGKRVPLHPVFKYSYLQDSLQVERHLREPPVLQQLRLDLVVRVDLLVQVVQLDLEVGHHVSQVVLVRLEDVDYQLGDG